MQKTAKINNANRTKIIATVGPASSDVKILEELIKNGCSVFRINFSHGSHEAHAQAISNIRLASKHLAQSVAILGDLQGPKIRIGAIIGDVIDLTNGQELILDSDIDDELGSANGVSYRCASLAESCKPGRVLMLDDGRVQLEVVSVKGNAITTKVIVGTKISSRKGLNLKGGGLAEEALTEKDNINFFGFLLSKPLYNSILWSIIAVLFGLLLIYIFRFNRIDNNTAITKITPESIKNLTKSPLLCSLPVTM